MDPCVAASGENVAAFESPRVGMEFESHEAAYSFYKDYAKSMGFGTAKLSSRRSRASKEFIDAKFSCIRYGSKQQSEDAVNPRPSPKIGCKASMHVKRRVDGKWYVYSFVKEHNHELLPTQAHLFRSHRDMDTLKNDAQVRRRKSIGSMPRLLGLYENDDCFDGFLRNRHDKGKSLVLEAGEVGMLLEMFSCMQEENPKFFYAVDLNEGNRLRTLFWVDVKGVEDYNHFGDVVCFDSTYFTNKYKIPLALFIGVNHHIQPILLGCALIADETVYTFVWLLQTWFAAMGERAPRVILTDQNSAMKSAVAAVFQQTRHCFCLWNVLEKVPKQLDFMSLFHENFMVKFEKCIFKSWTEEQFEKRWWKLVEKFHLGGVDWFRSLYNDRKYWVPTFMRDVSFAGLSTFSRSESLNSFFDKYVDAETTLIELIDKYKLIIENIYEEEAKADFDAWHEAPEMKSPSPFEKQLSLVYTHEIFKKFQTEVLGAAACHLKRESENEIITIYTVKDFEDNQSHMVEWNQSKSEICCSCHSFEYKGYLCRHAIVVFQMSGVFSIPSKYVLQRWTSVARSRHPLSEKMDEVQTKVRRFNDLCRRAIILGEEGSLSLDSYNIAISAIKEALKQCTSLNNFPENITGPNTTLSIETGLPNYCENMSVDFLPNTSVAGTNKVSRRGETGSKRESNGRNASKKPSQQLRGVSATPPSTFPHVEMSDTGPAWLPSLVPSQIQNVLPSVYQNISSAQIHGGCTKT